MRRFDVSQRAKLCRPRIQPEPSITGYGNALLNPMAHTPQYSRVIIVIGLMPAMAASVLHADAYHWVSGEASQFFADRSDLVIAAYYNPNGRGHVATVRPTGAAGDSPPKDGRGPRKPRILRCALLECAHLFQ